MTGPAFSAFNDLHWSKICGHQNAVQTLPACKLIHNLFIQEPQHCTSSETAWSAIAMFQQGVLYLMCLDGLTLTKHLGAEGGRLCSCSFFQPVPSLQTDLICQAWKSVSSSLIDTQGKACDAVELPDINESMQLSMFWQKKGMACLVWIYIESQSTWMRTSNASQNGACTTVGNCALLVII